MKCETSEAPTASLESAMVCGSRMCRSAMRLTSASIVALKNQVWRSFGSFSRIA